MRERHPAHREPTRSGAQDDCVLAAARAGDRAAFGRLYQRYRLYSQAVAYRAGVSMSDSEDVINEAWTRILAAFDRGVGPERNFGGYLALTVRSCAVDGWRATRRLLLTDSPADFELPVDEPEDEVETILAARSALAQLAVGPRELLEATFADDFRPASYARRFGISPGALASRAARARKSLRRAYFAA